jgi:hypothetical protein
MKLDEAGRGARRRRAAAGRAALAVALATLATGCAIPFGPGGDASSDSDAGRRSNRIYLEEQERVERGRQSFGDPFRSDR